jgi:hypothetical protein
MPVAAFIAGVLIAVLLGVAALEGQRQGRRERYGPSYEYQPPKEHRNGCLTDRHRCNS